MITREIATHLGVSKTALSRRAKKENWPYTTETCRGGKRRQYRTSDLPADIRTKISQVDVIADSVLGWFERIINSPRFERAQIYCLCVIVWFFLGYLYFRFQVVG